MNNSTIIFLLISAVVGYLVYDNYERSQVPAAPAAVQPTDQQAASYSQQVTNASPSALTVHETPKDSGTSNGKKGEVHHSMDDLRNGN